jgi:hypothetical protein
VPNVSALGRARSMTDIDVRCATAASGGWTCSVIVHDGADETRHEVTATPAELERLAPGAANPTALVERSFEFLLEREPPSSILRSFELSVISRYFPEYEREIRRPPEPG